MNFDRATIKDDIERAKELVRECVSSGKPIIKPNHHDTEEMIGASGACFKLGNVIIKRTKSFDSFRPEDFAELLKRCENGMNRGIDFAPTLDYNRINDETYIYMPHIKGTTFLKEFNNGSFAGSLCQMSVGSWEKFFNDNILIEQVGLHHGDKSPGNFIIAPDKNKISLIDYHMRESELSPTGRQAILSRVVDKIIDGMFFVSNNVHLKKMQKVIYSNMIEALRKIPNCEEALSCVKKELQKISGTSSQKVSEDITIS